MLFTGIIILRAYLVQLPYIHYITLSTHGIVMKYRSPVAALTLLHVAISKGLFSYIKIVIIIIISSYIIS